MKNISIYQTERNYITGMKIFIVTLIVIGLTIIAIWLFGLGQHRTLFENSILSTTILSITFFIFLSFNLFKGAKIKDDLGKITDKINKENIPDLTGYNLPTAEISDLDDIGGIIIGILTWIFVSIILVFVIWFLGAILWILVLVFSAMLYWIFFRALRLVFKNSNKCKNDFWKSIYTGLFYTILYNFWIYGIILTSHYLIK